MLNSPTILGIPMAPRKNRRLLVAATYVFFAACTAGVLIVPPWANRIEVIVCVGVIFPIVISSSVLFGKFAKGTMFGPPGGKMTGLSLAPKRRGLGESDERDVAVRNAAHYQAFRIVAMYGIGAFLLIPGLRGLNVSTVVTLVLLVAMPLFAMFWTLPQAIIIWTMPDMPEEDRVYNSK